MARPKAGKERPRRTKGSGSVYWSDRRKRWIGTYLTPDGTRCQVSHPASKVECERQLRKAMAAEERGEQVKADRITVAQYLEDWLGGAAVGRRSSTVQQYHKRVRRHLIPELGHIPLGKLTTGDVRAAYARLKEKKGLADTTVSGVHAVLHLALRAAVEDGRVRANAAEFRGVPKPNVRPFDVLTVEQERLLLATARGHRLSALFVLEACTGLRQSELLALTWKDVDFSRRQLRVRATFSGEGRERRLEAPKTKAGKRTIVLEDLALGALRDWWERQQEERNAAGETWVNSGFVFTTTRGTPQHRETVRRTLKRLLERAELPTVATFRSLRHTHASTALGELGMPVKDVAERLGHADPAMTLRVYTHVIAGAQERISKGIERLLTLDAE